MANEDLHKEKKPKLSALWFTLIPIFIFIFILFSGLFLIQHFFGEELHKRPHESLSVNTHISPFHFTKINQHKVHLENLDYKILIINFWASWCQPCIVEIPSLVKLYKKFESQGLKIAFINLDEKPEQMIPKILPPLGVDFDSYYDHEQKLSELFNVSGVPLTIVLDKNYKILFYEAGEKDWFDKKSIEHVEEWLKTAPPLSN